MQLCRGGIPLIFPQYGRASGVAAYAGVGSGRVPTNGFLSMLHWSLADAGGSDPDALDPAPTVVLEAESTEATYAIWPYHFRASYTVRLSEEAISEHLVHVPWLKQTAPLLNLLGPSYAALQLVRLSILLWPPMC